jgi:hypothetical protein
MLTRGIFFFFFFQLCYVELKQAEMEQEDDDADVADATSPSSPTMSRRVSATTSGDRGSAGVCLWERDRTNRFGFELIFQCIDSLTGMVFRRVCVVHCFPQESGLVDVLAAPNPKPPSCLPTKPPVVVRLYFCVVRRLASLRPHLAFTLAHLCFALFVASLVLFVAT